MISFKTFLSEQTEEGQKLKHITHAEDRPLQSGSSGYEHARSVLHKVHEHIKSGEHNSHVSMKYDGSPSIVFGHHPENGKFFVASKSAFNKNPKINHTDADIEKNHGHAPGLVHKLKSALHHLPKVAPKKGVYQGDMMYTHDDLEHHKDGKVSFTPNTIKYTAHGDEANRIKKSKMGVVVHTQYHGDDIHSMKSDPHPDTHNFKHHKDVWTKDVSHDTSKIHYPQADQEAFHHHMNAAHEIHTKHGSTMYKNTEKHQNSGHLENYINHTVRTGETPNHEGLKNHIQSKYEKEASKLKTPASQEKKMKESKEHTDHIETHKNDYNRMFEMHHHLQKAKDILVHNLNKHTDLEHHIGDKKTDPEGFVAHHEGQPTKLVNRKEFSRANLLKVR